MKKLLIFAFIVIASALLFIGASPWEGSAAIAPNGELPITGYYVATNAFPRNTVVDITNIETGRSTRVIVSNVLTSPGLLAIVSREAGELIGMRAGSLSRIRLIQPNDPMAATRFTQSMREGTPAFDSGNVITEDSLVAEIYNEDTYVPPDIGKTAEVERKPVMPAYIVDEPEWGGSGRLQIVDVPGFLSDPSDDKLDLDEGLASIDEPEYKQRDKDVSPKINERPPVAVAKDVPEYSSDRVWETNEVPPREVVKDVPVFITEAPREEVVKEVSPWEERTEVAKKTLVPRETSPNPPPSGVYGIDPNDIIPGIVTATPERPAPAPTANNTVNNNVTAVTTPSPAPVPSTDRNLPVNTIDRLDRGKYYVQVAAMSADLVENTLKQIDRSYAPVVFKGTDNLYRILIGPLNQGESAAVLSRFRSIGYKDAFVRKGG